MPDLDPYELQQPLIDETLDMSGPNDKTAPAIHIPASFPDIPEVEIPVTADPEPPALPDLTSHAYAVHHARVKYATLKAELDALTAEFEEQNRILIEAVADAKARLSSTEEEARAAAVTVFEVTGVKKLDAGFGIRVATKYQYDADEALSWAMEHQMISALQLRKTGFEKLLKAGGVNADDCWFETTEEPGATIPSDLTKHLQAAFDAIPEEDFAAALDDVADKIQAEFQRHVDEMAAEEQMRPPDHDDRVGPGFFNAPGYVDIDPDDDDNGVRLTSYPAPF